MLPNGGIPQDLLPDKFHRPVGGVTGSHKECDCSGASVKLNVFLGYQIHTDVLEIYLKSPLSEQWLGDSPEGPGHCYYSWRSLCVMSLRISLAL
jgi:DEAD/DEAH box helicase domain-containing protein